MIRAYTLFLAHHMNNTWFTVSQDATSIDDMYASNVCLRNVHNNRHQPIGLC